ncbi:hypothetical protein COO60DRAFT_1625980 [Scenedesmus sp. NREL 46B-D3]|nr:hypothetical protein COO60DRAFT_1625980 [Scenedesmus sp. NREL 46B-D3]
MPWQPATLLQATCGRQLSWLLALSVQWQVQQQFWLSSEGIVLPLKTCMPLHKHCATAPLLLLGCREKNFEKAQKEAKVKARKEAARHAELADNVTHDDLAAVEDVFFTEAGLESSSSQRLLVPAGQLATSSSEAAGTLRRRKDTVVLQVWRLEQRKAAAA